MAVKNVCNIIAILIVKKEAPWSMLFADDIVLCEKTREQLEGKLEEWRKALEGRGMKISRSKTEYMTNEEVDGLVIELQ